MPIRASFANKAFGGSRILGANPALNPQKTPTIDYILVGGGGGGGSIGGGGGGGGQVRFGVGYPVSPGLTLSIQIGGGGPGGGTSTPSGQGDGGSTIMSGPGVTTVTSIGGGYGGQPGGAGNPGGSGGGGGRDNTNPANRGLASPAPSNGPAVWGKNGGYGAPATPATPANNSGSGGGGGANGDGGVGGNGPNGSGGPLGSGPDGANEYGGPGGNGKGIGELFSSYDTNYRPPITKPYPNAPSHPVWAPLGISSDIFAAGGGGGISGNGQAANGTRSTTQYGGNNGGSSGGGSGYPHTGGDGGNGQNVAPLLIAPGKRQANSAVQYSGSGGGGGGTGPSGTNPATGQDWRAGGSGAGGRCIIRWDATEFANATSTSGQVYHHIGGSYRHFDWVDSGSITF